MIKNRIVALVFRLAAFLLILLGLLDNFGVFRGRFLPGALMYYTILSNLLALVLFGVLVVATLRQTAHPRLEFVVVANLLLTLAVYWLLLAPSMFSMGQGGGNWTFTNLSVHLITPLACLLDYLLFAPRHRLKYRDVYLMLLFPLCYLVFASLAGKLGYIFATGADGAPIHYPYPFMDYDRLGLRAIPNILGVSLALILVGHLFYWLDREKPQRKASAKH